MTPAALSVRMACSGADIEAAQRLRYHVFVKERGAKVAACHHAVEREADRFDAHASHLLLEDHTRPENDRVVGTYRLMNPAQAKRAGGFYCASEFDLTGVLSAARHVMELGRSCIHPEYRTGPGLMMLWAGLAREVQHQKAETLFGAASFAGTDIATHHLALSYLHQFHGAGGDQPTGPWLDKGQIDRKAALAAMPPLIKAYLRLGAVVADGFFVDEAFNTIDVCMILNTNQISAKHRARFDAAGTG